jgi:uncharacterized membrane protein (UPF0127 family)
MTRASVVDEGRGAIVCERCVVADRPLARLRGLLGRRELPAGEGLLLRPTGAVHTSFMRFPIDVVFLDRELTVIGVVDGLAPWRAAGRRGARAVLELAAGERASRAISPGDRLALVPAGSR